MITALTGHRPPKGGLTYSHEAPGDLLAMQRVRDWLSAVRPSSVIAGGALGFDTLGARAAWLEGIDFFLYVPFNGQESQWPTRARERYYAMLKAAADVRIISGGGYSAHKMQLRNEAMVDDATDLWTWWDGSYGGTRNCIDYARDKVDISHLYDKETS